MSIPHHLAHQFGGFELCICNSLRYECRPAHVCLSTEGKGNPTAALGCLLLANIRPIRLWHWVCTFWQRGEPTNVYGVGPVCSYGEHVTFGGACCSARGD